LALFETDQRGVQSKPSGDDWQQRKESRRGFTRIQLLTHSLTNYAHTHTHIAPPYTDWLAGEHDERAVGRLTKVVSGVSVGGVRYE
jgi:hypothetical protein